jgi:hypothetical protein
MQPAFLLNLDVCQISHVENSEGRVLDRYCDSQMEQEYFKLNKVLLASIIFGTITIMQRILLPQGREYRHCAVFVHSA